MAYFRIYIFLYFLYIVATEEEKITAPKHLGIGNSIEWARKYGAESTGRPFKPAGPGGDLRLTEEQKEFLFDAEDKGNRTKRAGSLNSINYWLNGVVPYFIQMKDFQLYEVSEIKEAMDVYEEETCVKFIPADPTVHKTHLWIRHTEEGCFSYLGNLNQGPQTVSLSQTGCRHFGTYLHELGHALGMIHEHQRPDRNSYIRYYPGNVDPNFEDQLVLYNAQATRLFQHIPYDLSSIMHYEVDTFSFDEVSPTLGVDNPWLAKHVGRRYSNKLSFGDVKLLNLVYQCGRHCGNVHCGNGFVNKACQCVTYDAYMRKVCTNDPTLVEWCYDLVITGQCDVTNIEHHRKCARACDFCPRFKLGQKAIVTGTPPTKLEWKELCQDQYLYPALCQQWAAMGKCTYPWMQRYCRRSCKACKSGIGDCPNLFDDRLCDAYALKRVCTFKGKEGDFVRAKCKDSCGICFTSSMGKCRNRVSDEACKLMYNQRKCDIQPLVAYQSCPSTCNRCDFNAGNCRNIASDEFCAEAAVKNLCLSGDKKLAIRKQCPKHCNSCTGIKSFFSRLGNF